MGSHVLARAKGVARNPSVPEELLLRLVNAEHTLSFTAIYRKDLPTSVYDAVVAHPNWRVRATMADCWNAPARQRARLAADPDRRVRMTVAGGPFPFRMAVEPLPDETYALLAKDIDPQVRGEVAGLRHLPDGIRLALIADPEPSVRSHALNAWPHTPSHIIEELTHDPDPTVRHWALMRNPANAAGRLIAHPEMFGYSRPDWAAVVRLDPDQALILAEDQDTMVRAAVAENPTLPADPVARLAVDPEHDVRLAVSMRQELTEQQRAAIDYQVRPTDRLHPPRWVVHSLENLELMRMCAESAHIGLRRCAAYSPHLAPDLVAALAGDPDFAVRLLLCENHPDAPAELLLATFLEAKVITRYDLVNRPNFPRTGLARLATSAQPEARRLALLDPDITATTVEHLSHDPVDWVRSAAASHSALPTARVVALLGQQPTAEAAASHPGLTIDMMVKILDEAGVPAAGAQPTAEPD